jgi:hypothetical protein
MITLQRFLSNRRRAQAMLDLKRRRKPALIVTLEGQHTHTVRYLFEDDVALTHCGMRVPDAKHLIDTAAELRTTPGCANCDRTLRGAERRAGPHPVRSDALPPALPVLRDEGHGRGSGGEP